MIIRLKIKVFGVDWRELLLTLMTIEHLPQACTALSSVMVEKLGSWLEAEGPYVGTKDR